MPSEKRLLRPACGDGSVFVGIRPRKAPSHGNLDIESHLVLRADVDIGGGRHFHFIWVHDAKIIAANITAAKGAAAHGCAYRSTQYLAGGLIPAWIVQVSSNI